MSKLTNSTNTLVSTFAKATSRTAQIGTQFSTLDTSVSNLNRRIGELQAKRDILPLSEISKIRALNSEINTLTSRMGKMQTLNGSWFKSKASEAFNALPGAGFIANPLVAIGAGIGFSVKQGMENELQKQNITTLMGGDTAGANKLFGQIADYGKNTVYDKAGLIDAQKTMMSFGLTSDFAFEKLKNIGDIAMGDKNRMSALSLAFSQATSTGKLMGQDYLQMVNAGFNPLNTIAQRTGESMASLKKRMSDGKISANELSNAFQWATEQGGLFYQGAEKAGNTLSGRMNKLTDSISEMAISLYSAIEPVLSPLVSFATKLFEVIGGGIAWVVNAFKEGNPVIITAASVIGSLAVAIGIYKAVTAIATIVQNGFNLAIIASNLALLANPIVWIVALVVGFVAAIVLLWNKCEGFRKIIYGLWEVIKGFGNIIKEFVIDRIKGLLSGIGSLGQALVKLFKGDFKGAWADAGRGAIDISGINTVKKAGQSAMQLGDAYKKGAEQGAKSFQASKSTKQEKQADTNNSLLTDINKNTAENNELVSSNNKSISSGGPKTINITVGKFLDAINITTNNLRESENEIEARILEMFGRIVVQGGYAQ